jgi:hypothetical protein
MLRTAAKYRDRPAGQLHLHPSFHLPKFFPINSSSSGPIERVTSFRQPCKDAGKVHAMAQTERFEASLWISLTLGASEMRGIGLAARP